MWMEGRVMMASRKGNSTCRVGALLLAFALMMAVPLGGCGGRKETRVVRMGYLRNDLHQLAYYVAREKGFFAEEGLDVREGGAFNAGPEEMSAFSAGELDMGYVGTAPAVTFSGRDMARVKVVAQANQEGSAVVVRNGLEAEDVSALKGRTVAVPGYSTVQDFLLRMALDEKKLAPGDVNTITLKPPEMISALANSQVDAFVAWEPYPSQAVQQKAGRVLLYSGRIWPRHPCCVLVVDEAFLGRAPDTVRRLVAAHVKATRYINDNPAEALDMAHLFTGQGIDVVGSAMKHIEFAYEPDVEAIERYAEFLNASGVIKVESPRTFTRELVDKEFLPGGEK